MVELSTTNPFTLAFFYFIGCSALGFGEYFRYDFMGGRLLSTLFCVEKDYESGWNDALIFMHALADLIFALLACSFSGSADTTTLNDATNIFMIFFLVQAIFFFRNQLAGYRGHENSILAFFGKFGLQAPIFDSMAVLPCFATTVLFAVWFCKTNEALKNGTEVENQKLFFGIFLFFMIVFAIQIVQAFMKGEITFGCNDFSKMFGDLLPCFNIQGSENVDSADAEEPVAAVADDTRFTSAADQRMQSTPMAAPMNGAYDQRSVNPQYSPVGNQQYSPAGGNNQNYGAPDGGNAGGNNQSEYTLKPQYPVVSRNAGSPMFGAQGPPQGGRQ